MKLNKNSFLYKLIFGLIWPKKRLVKLLAWNFRYKIKDGFSKGMIYPYFSVEDNPGAKFIGTYENVEEKIDKESKAGRCKRHRQDASRWKNYCEVCG